MKNDLNKTKEQLSFELNDLRNKSKEREEKLKAINQQLRAANQQLEAYQQQLIANEQQLRAANQQLDASNQQLRASEKSLKKEKEFSENLLITANAFILTLDINANITLFNKFAEKLTGYKKEEVIGKNWFDIFIPKQNGNSISEVYTNVLKKMPEFFSCENSVLCKNGSERLIKWENTVLKNENGEISGVLSIGTDITERKQAEENIRKLSKVVETTPDAVVISDMKGKIEYVNQGLLTIGGFEDESSIIGKSVYIFTNEEGVKRLKEEVIPTILSEGKWEGELFVKRKDGSIFPADFVSTVILNEEGKPKYLLSNFRDITEKKQAEMALKESEAKFRLLFSEMTEGVYLHEIIYNKKGKAIDYRIIETNPASEKYLNIKPGYAIGKLATDLYGTNEAPFLDIYANVAGTGRSVEFEEYFPPMKKYFHISVYCPERGKFATIFTDITERKQAEEALKESEEKYRTFINTASDLMCITDEEGKFTEVNESMINKLEYSRNELIGNHFRIILTKESIEKDILPNWDKFIENGKISIETTFLSKKGNELYCVLKGIGIYDDNNKFIGSRAVIHDLTQRKQADEALKKRMNELEIFNEAAVGRELKIIELKKEINELLVKTGQKPKYEIIV